MITEHYVSIVDGIGSAAELANNLYAKYFHGFLIPSKSVILAAATATGASVRYIWSEFQKQSARRKEQAIKAADEVDGFYENSSVWLATRFIDYENFTIEKADLNCLENSMTSNDIWNCLICHADRDVKDAKITSERVRIFTHDERMIRDLFDRFLTKLERMEKLIERGVISKSDFRDFFSYWLQLMSEIPIRGDRVQHLSDERRIMLWKYIRGYEYTGVIKLFKMYGRAYPVGIAAGKAFQNRHRKLQ